MPAPGFRQTWRSVPAREAYAWHRRGWTLHGYTRAETPAATPAEATGARHPMRDVAILRRPLVLRDDADAA